VEVAETFRLGYAPQGWDGLKGYLAREGVPQEMAEKAGLLARKEGGTSAYDRFRDRIIFPIVDVSGGVVAFGGRVMDDSLPKYLNSPETPIYSKSRLLYGLSSSRHEIRRTQCSLLVEGYLDLISLWQAGVRNAAATLGTALTASHLRLLRGQGSDQKVVVVFDSDLAGQTAAARSLGLFLQEGVQARLLLLPQGEDPDSHVRKQGPELFLAAAERSVPLLEFYIDRVAAAHGPSPEGRLAAARELSAMLANVGSAVERAYYVKRLSERLGLDESALAKEVRGHATEEAGGLEAALARGSVRPSLERTVVKLAVADARAAKRFAEALAWEQFEDKLLAKLAEEACARPGPLGSLIDRLAPELAALATELGMSEEFAGPEEVCQACDDCLARLAARRAQGVSRSLDDELRVAEKAGDAERVRALLTRKMEVLRQRPAAKAL
jgi:DNA primase